MPHLSSWGAGGLTAGQKNIKTTHHYPQCQLTAQTDDDESNDQDCSTTPFTRSVSGSLSSDASSRFLGSGWTDCWTEAYHPPELSEIGGLPPPSMLSGGADDDESNDLDCNTTPLITRSISGPLSSDASSQCFGSGWVDFAGQGGATELAAGFQ